MRASCMTPDCAFPAQVLWRIPFTEPDGDSVEPATRRINVWLCLEHYNEVCHIAGRVPLDRPFAFDAS